MSGGRRLVLVGAGHAHLQVLAETGAFTRRGHEVVLVAPGPFWYSGLATGMLGGRYPPSLDRIDAGALVRRGGGRFVEDRVIRLEPRERTLHLACGGRLSYDVLSLNLGSETVPIPGEEERPERCFSVKPIRRLWDLHQAVVRGIEAGRPPPVVIAGGGATAFELAANILHLGEGRGTAVPLTILAGGGTVLKQLPRRAAASVERSLVGRGARVVRGSRAARIEDSGVETEAGSRYPYAIFVNATGLRPRPLAGKAGLPASEDGAMIVDAHLRSVADPLVHGGGDGIALQGHDLPKVGVHAIRQAPVLRRNLLAALEDQPPGRFTPQRRYLWIMNLGDGTGLAARGALWWRGRSAFWLKDRIDRRFLARYATA